MLHETIRLERGTVHYWIDRCDRSDRTIVFSHGLTANHSMFEKQVEYFRQVCTVITWDIPLHGLSRPYQDFSYENCARDLCAILDQESIGKVILVGMSMGGYPSQMFAHLYPERTEGFVALDTTPFGLGYYSKSDIWWLNRVGAMAKWFPDQVLRKSMAKSISRTEYSFGMMMKMLEPLSKAEIAAQMDIAYRGFIRENRDVSFRFPVLILLGEYDRSAKVRQYCISWAKRNGYPLVMIKNAAHFSNGDNPEQVNEEIRKFIERL